MCGFFQVIQKNGPVDRDKFAAALASLQHRGPDALGLHFAQFNNTKGEAIHAAFGHQRLSILDLSPDSNQPFFRDSHILLFNGEIYNYRAIGKELEQQGVELHTDGDTEVLIESLIRHGEQALHTFNGMWAFSLFKPGHTRLLLSRDRYGKKPLFYFQDENTFCASSSIRAIKIYLDLKLEFRRDVLLDFVLFGTLYPSASSETHFRQISQILPGHNGHFDCNNWTMCQQTYFDARQAPQSADRPLEDDLADSVAARLVSDRPVALLLSGGVDSSLLLSIMIHQGWSEQVKIFMGDTGRSEDYAYAKKCVEQAGLEAETVTLDYDHNTFERFLKVCWHHEKPFPLNGNAMAMPQMYQEIAARDIPVVLDGSGGDEVFGGYWERHMPFAMRQAVREKNWSWIRQMLAANGGNNRVRQSLLSAFIPARWLDAQHSFRTHLGKQVHPLLKVSTAEVWGATDPDPLNAMSAGFSKALSLDVGSGGRLGEWIWHNDRNSMMFGVESRSPLLDCRLHAWLFFGYANKYQENWNKHELRQVFSRFVPLPTQWRQQKQGFRWDGKHFIYNNRDQILALIESSKSVAEVINLPRFLAIARKNPKILRSSLGKQALCVAGIEQTLMSAN